jgi:acyl-CoA reductase-like NAD-dependent aldehyde dehydrogenase
VTTTEDVTRAAAVAATEYAKWNGAQRQNLLEACAAALEERTDEVVAIAMAETGLTETRLRGEVARTTDQLRQFGAFVAAGRHHDGRLSAGAAGGADVLAVAVPIGPVAVFAASNFPFAFGVAGGDTASALAAGCPVVVKGHPAQPRTSRAVAAAIEAGLSGVKAPAGTFTMLDDSSPEASIALVKAPEIRAVGFTGSLGGGQALMAAAASRPDPIPVYAEMGSLNPVFVLPGAAADPAWAATLAGSVTGSAGQLCTKPGLIVCPDTEAGLALADAIAAAVSAAPATTMLTDGMAAAHQRWLDEAGKNAGVTVYGGSVEVGGRAPKPFAVRVAGTDLEGDLLEEHFGPTVVVATAPVGDYPALAERLDGSLTATLVGTGDDIDEAARVLPILTGVAGRVIWNGVPTGVAVCDAMVHGGPWPATSASWSTSVGTAAIHRFLRPVAMQGLPAELLAAVGISDKGTR